MHSKKLTDMFACVYFQVSGGHDLAQKLGRFVKVVYRYRVVL